ncbi:(2,3-dihydroxybenzoyl)adenylate synthase [Burkholderia alba]|uniref:(2,3-dihydroxybenzoyl)adenylate synthase n=1 Tax=Burkholderia alba TaxID=2683677 RepID=UPI002B05883D|nr:AMP-binding protein [Burkholderia alba]
MTTFDDFPRYPEAERYRCDGFWTGETLGAMLRRAALTRPDAPAVLDGGRRVTYRELDSTVDRIANGLAAAGLRAGDRVVVQLPNSIEFVEALFGLARIGAVPVMALPSDRIGELKHVAAGTGAVGYWIQDRIFATDYLPIAAELIDAVDTVRHVFVVGEAGRYRTHASLYGAETRHPEPEASAAALVMLSGGSTGLPKFIVRTHEDYLYSVRRSADVCELSARTAYLCVLPAAHNFTMSSPGVLGVIHAGGCIVMLREPSGHAALNALAFLEPGREAFTSLVPGLAQAWLETTPPRAFAALDFVQIGGAALSPDVAARVLEHFGCELQQVFGMTEGMVAYTRRGDPPERVLHTQGLPMSIADEIAIVDDDDRPVPDGETGHLLVRGPYTIPGYFRASPQAALAFTRDGYYRTGDRVCRRADGYLVVEGRVKDQINRGGEKIAAEEIESHLLASPCVCEAAVVGLPDRYLGEVSCAFVVVAGETRDARALAGQLRAFVRERGVASFKVPDMVRIVPALPKTTLGKIDKKVLRARFIPEYETALGVA